MPRIVGREWNWYVKTGTRVLAGPYSTQKEAKKWISAHKKRAQETRKTHHTKRHTFSWVF